VRPHKNRTSVGKGKIPGLFDRTQVNLGMGFEIPIEGSCAGLGRSDYKKIRQL